ncbi:hypothetical protein WJX72_012382 [[Myrmecia] bisecta]|uniref:SCD domain-containing protein n=1 Tax=[Myrmecia] bisecta TaxID=41462 RepID=A0AAW1Q2X0_9CHLO
MVVLRQRSPRAAAPANLAEVDDARSDSEESGEEADSDVEEADMTPATSAKQKRAKSPVSGRKRKAEKVVEDPGELTMLEIVKNHGTAITVAAKEWVDRYREDRAAATAELLTLLVQASGSTYVLSADEAEEGEVDKLVQKLLTKATQDGYDDLFKAKGQRDHFKANYLEMWDKLVRECHTEEILFDEYLLEKVTHLVIGLNCSVARCFRYTATLTGSQVVTSFIRVMVTLTAARETAQRQLAAEEKKKASKAGAERIVAFKRTMDRCHRHVNSLKDTINNLFQAVSAHRFRDVSPEIRAVVIEGIGHWIKHLPSVFMMDSYLKYLGWALSDKEGRVRETAVNALLELYSNRDHVSPLHEFTDRFKSRYAELIRDKDEHVAVKGVRLLTMMVKLEEIPHGQVKEVYQLLLDDSHQLRHAAAELVSDLLVELGQHQLTQAKPPARGTPSKGKKAAEKPSEKELQLAGLQHMMLMLANDEEEAGSARRRLSTQGLMEEQPLAPIMVSHIVDALFDWVDVLSDWKTLIGTLLDDKAAEARSDAATTNLPPVAVRADVRKGSKAKQQMAAQSARQEVTLLLSKDLPALMRKYQTDAVKAAALVSILRDLKLDIFSLKRQEAGFEALLRVVADVQSKHVDREVVDECTKTLVYCAHEAPEALKDSAGLVLSETVDDLAKKLSKALARVDKLQPAELADAVASLAEAGADEDEDLFALRAALLRLLSLLRISDAGAQHDAVRKTLHKLLQASAEGRNLGAPISELAAKGMVLLHGWSLAQLDPEEAEDEDVDAAKAGSLGAALKQLVGQLNAMFDNAEEEALQDALYYILADTYCIFNVNRLKDIALEAAGLSPSQEDLRRLWSHCETMLNRDLPEVPDRDEDEEETEAEAQERRAAEAAAERAIEAKCKAINAAGRLVVTESAAEQEWLGAQLVSHYTAHEKQVGEAVKEVCRMLKKNDPNAMPQIYLAAMQHAFQRHLDDDCSQDTMADFQSLCQRVAATYAGFNVSAAALLHMAKGGIDFALRDPPDHLAFLDGLLAIAARLPAKQAEAAAAHLEKAAAPHQPATDDSLWQEYFAFGEALKERAVKGKTPRSALRHAACAKGDGPRRISFMGAQEKAKRGRKARDPNDDEAEEGEEAHPADDSSEGEEPPEADGNGNDDAEEVEEAEELIEEGDAEPAHDTIESSPANTGTPAGGWRTSRRHAGQSPVKSPRFSRQQAHASGEADADAEAAPAADAAEEDEEMVVPTEEQLPGAGRRRVTPARPARKAPQVQRLYDDDDDAAAVLRAPSEGKESSSDDEELLAAAQAGAGPSRTSNKRPREAPAEPTQETQDMDDIEPPPRARRRHRV